MYPAEVIEFILSAEKAEQGDRPIELVGSHCAMKNTPAGLIEVYTVVYETIQPWNTDTGQEKRQLRVAVYKVIELYDEPQPLTSIVVQPYVVAGDSAS